MAHFYPNSPVFRIKMIALSVLVAGVGHNL
jgi:hypothetical protein